jgi:hypothetical protein
MGGLAAEKLSWRCSKRFVAESLFASRVAQRVLDVTVWPDHTQLPVADNLLLIPNRIIGGRETMRTLLSRNPTAK